MALDTKRFLAALAASDGWVDAGFLAQTLGVTTRTVRNYVRNINAGSDEPIIESSYRGYRLAKNGAASAKKPEFVEERPQEERANIILRRLISAQTPISVYDLADELYVSDSTIEQDLRRVRDSVRLFDVGIVRNRDTVMLEGSELAKRKLIGQLLISWGPAGFTALTGSGIVREGYDRTSLTRMVREHLDEQGLKSDDFGLNNIVVHLVIMCERMRQGSSMPDDGSYEKVEGTPATRAAQAASKEVCDPFGIDVPKSEIGYLALVIASNSRSVDYSFARSAELSELISPEDMMLTRDAVAALEQAYHLEPFDEDFMMRMAVHVHSLLQRIEGNIGSRNPLLSTVKETYPLIYDMAVYLANYLAEERGAALTEDEISFLAFHIGAHLEKNSSAGDTVTCTFLYVDYHDLYRTSLDRLRDELGERLQVVRAEAIRDYDPATTVTDLVITPVEVEQPAAGRVVLVAPLVKDADIRRVRRAVEAEQKRKRSLEAYALIERFLDPRLFTRNARPKDKDELIRSLCARCEELGYVDESFVDEVLDRERLSSTAFGNRVAIPHSMTASAHRSFLSVVVNEKPLRWDDNDVNLVMLMGLSAGDRAAFRMLFDSLLEVLSEPSSVNALSRCDSYASFSEQLNTLIMDSEGV